MSITLLVVTLLGVANAFDYCSISSQNTRCLHGVDDIGSSCEQVYQISLNDAEKDYIVSIHNELRRKVAKGLETRGQNGPQPSAANMRELQWDDELADMAQTHANQCKFQHDSNRNVERFQVGQNLAIQFSTGTWTMSSWESMINSWYDEVSAMDTSYVSSFPASSSYGVIGHYTQAVWAETSLVGCGIMSYKDTSFFGTYPYKLLYVCNYGSAGNWLGSSVYQIGAAASACPAGTVASDGLCA